MAVPMSGCTLGLQYLKEKKKGKKIGIHEQTSVPKEESCAGGNNHFSTQSLSFFAL